MKATAVAPANIAFIKYWGKKDDTLRLPLNSSLSMNLSGMTTTTTIEFSRAFTHDTVELAGEELIPKEVERTKKHLDRIRKRANKNAFARVVTKNSFPKGAGAASSASGFAALTVAGFAAAQLALSEKELTVFARLGSGSACRSIPDGFVVWQTGDTSDESYAYSVAPSTHWNLCDIFVVVENPYKKVSTTEGMDGATTSPFWQCRYYDIQAKFDSALDALQRKDFAVFGLLIQEEAVNMHGVIMTQRPPIFYWNRTTMDIIKSVHEWQQEGIAVSFTIDAGPSIHLICEEAAVAEFGKKAEKIKGVTNVIVNKPAPGAHVIKNHLF